MGRGCLLSVAFTRLCHWAEFRQVQVPGLFGGEEVLRLSFDPLLTLASPLGFEGPGFIH